MYEKVANNLTIYKIVVIYKWEKVLYSKPTGRKGARENPLRPFFARIKSRAIYKGRRNRYV